ncbi:MAG: DUF7455 domain-containing protein [Arthrobacter sp.]
MTEPAVETRTSLFTAKDRCDRCGAQAKTLALLVTGILLFCAHHTHEYLPGLIAAGAEVETELK